MAEISKGVWVPQGTAYKRYEAGAVEEEGRAMLSCAAAPVPKPRGKVIINPEDEECDCRLEECVECYEQEQAEAARAAAAAVVAEEDAMLRPLEPVAAYTYEEATARAAAAKPSALEKAFKNHPDAAEDYSTSEWNEVPDVTRPEPFVAAWYNCVKRYRFVQVGDRPLGGGPRLIIELELMSGTTLRHIIKLAQVKSILTKGHTRDTHGYVAIEEVIIDMRHRGYGYNPDQVKLRFAGGDNALAFHMALEAAM
jgi:hypothetical protein